MSEAPDWILQCPTEQTKIHFAKYSGDSEYRAIQRFVDHTVERAIAIIPQSLRQDGRYLLFDWNARSATLSIVTTDDSKSNDSPEAVEVVITPWQQQGGANTEQSADLQYWLHDYLTTASAFLQFSLIAVYCEGDRQRTQLL